MAACKPQRVWGLKGKVLQVGDELDGNQHSRCRYRASRKGQQADALGERLFGIHQYIKFGKLATQ